VSQIVGSKLAFYSILRQKKLSGRHDPRIVDENVNGFGGCLDLLHSLTDRFIAEEVKLNKFDLNVWANRFDFIDDRGNLLWTTTSENE
jgi:hypothetical protein